MPNTTTSSPAPATTGNGRRTQEERKAATRRALLDATIETMVELGYANTTTTEVTKRAGVSQGALFKHFPTKAALLGAAAEDLFPRLRAEYREAFEAVPETGDRVRAAVDLLWDVFQKPELQAAIELYVAARTDEELAAVLTEVDAPHRAELRAIAREFFPLAAERQGEAFDSVVDLVIDSIQGAALGSLAVPDAPRRERELTYLTALLRLALEGAADLTTGE